ncbi:MAG: hypothetical protein WCH84_10625 [Verrucomicrobiota bacterium]
MKRIWLWLLVWELGLGAVSVTRAELALHALFSGNAVLQQGMPVPIWGTAAEGEKVTVKFAGQEVATTAQNGRWQVQLKPLAAGGPFPLTVTGANKIEVKDLLLHGIPVELDAALTSELIMYQKI